MLQSGTWGEEQLSGWTQLSYRSHRRLYIYR
jgi:hypothetical protein